MNKSSPPAIGTALAPWRHRVLLLERHATGSVARCALTLRAVPDGPPAVLATADIHFDDQ